MKNYKWWQDNERYIPDPWDEIAKFEQELKQMAITESALRESLTELSRESLSYRHQIETENAKLREALKEISTTAHCIAKAGPLNTPTLQDAWGKFMYIDAMATKALSK
jgi:regulator of replication initiation timing